MAKSIKLKNDTYWDNSSIHTPSEDLSNRITILSAIPGLSIVRARGKKVGSMRCLNITLKASQDIPTGDLEPCLQLPSDYAPNTHEPQGIVLADNNYSYPTWYGWSTGYGWFKITGVGYVYIRIRQSGMRVLSFNVVY